MPSPCRHVAYCKNNHRCREFAGNLLGGIIGGCPLVPTQAEVAALTRAHGGLTLCQPTADDGALSLAAKDTHHG